MPFLEFHGISKRFPGVLALDGVSFAVERGTCHALIGENGAGKSTLGKILAGVHTADAGELRLEGHAIRPHTPLAARELGIAMVHQELAFCPNLSVAENLCLGDLPRRGGFVDRAELRRRARAMLATINADIDPEAIIGTLSTGREQLVQIAAAVGTGAKVIVMDEPTSSLSAAETAELFKLVRELKGRGITLIYVSHRLEELFALCDHITVLRDGRHVITEEVAQTNPHRVVTQMIGRELLISTPAHLGREPGPVRLAVRGLTSGSLFRDINLEVRAGEIVGVAGIVGAGRSEMAQAIFGLDPEATGEVEVAGRPLALGSVDAALAAGLGLVPEDRKRQGLVLGLNCRENTVLSALPALSSFGWVRRAAERSLAKRYADRLRVKAPSLETITAGLSGGNQQKIALAKWLARSCDVLLIDEPTRGVDVGAKAEIYQLLDELACEGKALLVVSSELPELIGLCRRILVMRAGRLAGEVQRPDFSEAALMRLMAGVAAA
ncbi:MAG TPA: sugar ABC transporter ATP-binding protein [Lacunisphaera sp.]|nr:sugar ABC transporter ATP-binding protein [Lacunisphaera sp.]